jgi:predicted transcriptional regulator
MPLQLPPDLERRISQLATATHREPLAVLTDLVDAALDEDAAFRCEVRAGLDELDRGDVVDHEEAKRRLRAAIERHGARTWCGSFGPNGR